MLNERCIINESVSTDSYDRRSVDQLYGLWSNQAIEFKFFYYFVEFISRDRTGKNTYTINAYIYIFCDSLIKNLTVDMLKHIGVAIF